MEFLLFDWYRYSSAITAAVATRKWQRCHVLPDCHPKEVPEKCATATGSVFFVRRLSSRRSSTSSVPKSKVSERERMGQCQVRSVDESLPSSFSRRARLRGRPANRRQHGAGRLLLARFARRRRGINLRRSASRPFASFFAFPTHHGPHLARWISPLSLIKTTQSKWWPCAQ